MMMNRNGQNGESYSSVYTCKRHSRVKPLGQMINRNEHKNCWWIFHQFTTLQTSFSCLLKDTHKESYPQGGSNDDKQKWAQNAQGIRLIHQFCQTPFSRNTPLSRWVKWWTRINKMVSLFHQFTTHCKSHAFSCHDMLRVGDHLLGHQWQGRIHSLIHHLLVCLWRIAIELCNSFLNHSISKYLKAKDKWKFNMTRCTTAYTFKILIFPVLAFWDTLHKK